MSGPRWNAVDRVMGRLFEHGPLRVGGGGSGGGKARRVAAARPALRRMSRIGARDGAAVFKLIKSGGTTSRSGLKGQLAYIFRDDKLARVIDPTGRLEPDARPEGAQLDRLTRAWSRSWWADTRGGNTSHMILSYPKGVPVDRVEAITRDVCAQMLEDGPRRFDYVAAIHVDTDHHPHAHVIVNRRAGDDSLFTLRAGTALSYEGFREAMASHGERHGVYLDPSFRFERGLTARQPTRAEQRVAQVEGRVPADRPREGTSRDHHEGLIGQARVMARAMDVMVGATEVEGLDYERLLAMLGEPGGTDRGEEGWGGDPYDYLEDEADRRRAAGDDLRAFDRMADIVAGELELAEAEMGSADPGKRARGEWRLVAMLRDLTERDPAAVRAEALHRPPEGASIYQHGPGPAEVSALETPEVRARLDEVERDSGIPAAAVAERVTCRAVSEHLEQTWLTADAQAIMERHGLRIDIPDQRAEVMDRLDAAHVALRKVLVSAGVIEHLPHLDPDHDWAPPREAVYRYSADRIEAELPAVVAHYRQAGAPAAWIADNRDALAGDLADRRADERAAFLARHPDLSALVNALGSGGHDAPAVEPLAAEAARTRLLSNVYARRLVREDPAEMRQAVGADYAARLSGIPHDLADRLADLAVREHAAERDRRRHDTGQGRTPDAPPADPEDRAGLLARLDALVRLGDRLLGEVGERGDDRSGDRPREDEYDRDDDHDRDDDYGR